jgi:hypothetical protein
MSGSAPAGPRPERRRWFGTPIKLALGCLLVVIAAAGGTAVFVLEQVHTVVQDLKVNVPLKVDSRALATRPGVVKSRNALMDAAYDDQVYVDDRTIDSHIKRLRKKFKLVDDDFDAIETLYGVGYRYREA